MKFTILALSLLSVAAFAKDYGKGVVSKDAPISLTDAIGKIDSMDGKEVVVKSTIGTVCKEKGCWMMLDDGKNKIRVTFENYSFFVPKDSAKKTAIVQGRMFWKDLGAGEARHYAKDEGKNKAEVAMIKEAKKTPWFEATGLKIED